MSNRGIRILHMYADMLDLYGDGGNMEILKYRCKMRGIDCEITHYSAGTEMPDFTAYDLIYIGGGADLEQQHIAADLMKCREGLKKAYEAGVFFLLICGGYQLMGKYYRDADGNDIPGLGLFDYYTVAPNSRKARCIGNIVVRTEITGKPVDVVGFENHGGQTMDVKKPFGRVVHGNGNCSGGEYEGYCEDNVIATYLHGPLLAKNPEISDKIIHYCMQRVLCASGSDEAYVLTPLDDTLEKQCRNVMIERLLNKNEK